VRFVRFEYGGRISYGLLNGDSVQAIEGDPFSDPRPVGDRRPVESVRLLAPCVPSKIVAVGVNYKDHAAEFKHDLPKEPILFLKATSAVLDPGDAIRLPDSSKRVDFEAELGVVIGKKTRSIAPDEARGAILGYTCFNDVTARDLQKRDGQWARAKSFDTFAPFGPWIETDVDPGSLKIESRLNGERRQSASTSDLIFKVPELVSFISRVMTLLPGDLIATGTPAGVGPMQSGDVIEIVIEGIGRLSNPVNK
jgi:2-keto-4-pentenoate hydratase/2-oxohepta-3-ene-1,7-dioic acid hydratase in catechol pathway